MKLAIVIGSIREGRKGDAVAKWIRKQVETLPANETHNIEWTILDVRDFHLPLLSSPTVPGAARRHYETPEVGAWSKAIDECDGFLWVTPEYNHSVPGALKNAHDLLGPEWWGKGVGFVSYGADSGVRAVEHWRQICANVGMVAVRPQLALSLFRDWNEGAFKPSEQRTQTLAAVATSLAEMTARHLDDRH